MKDINEANALSQQTQIAINVERDFVTEPGQCVHLDLTMLVGAVIQTTTHTQLILTIPPVPKPQNDEVH